MPENINLAKLVEMHLENPLSVEELLDTMGDDSTIKRVTMEVIMKKVREIRFLTNIMDGAIEAADWEKAILAMTMIAEKVSAESANSLAPILVVYAKMEGYDMPEECPMDLYESIQKAMLRSTFRD